MAYSLASSLSCPEQKTILMGTPAGCANVNAEELLQYVAVTFVAETPNPAAIVSIKKRRAKETENMACGELGCIESTITCVIVAAIPIPPAIHITADEESALTLFGTRLKNSNLGRMKVAITIA